MVIDSIAGKPYKVATDIVGFFHLFDILCDLDLTVLQDIMAMIEMAGFAADMIRQLPTELEPQFFNGGHMPTVSLLFSNNIVSRQRSPILPIFSRLPT